MIEAAKGHGLLCANGTEFMQDGGVAPSLIAAANAAKILTKQHGPFDADYARAEGGRFFPFQAFCKIDRRCAQLSCFKSFNEPVRPSFNQDRLTGFSTITGETNVAVGKETEDNDA